MGKRILIADDSRFQRELLRETLRSVPGYSVREVVDGAMALVAFAGEPFDLVILDIDMPGLNGVEAMCRMKLDRPDVIVGLVTGHSSDALRQHSLSAGADFFITKPFNTATILDAVKRAESTRLAAPVARVLVADDSRTIRSLMAETLKMVGLKHRLDLAADGAEAAALFQKAGHDLVFLDVNMPGMNGLDLLRMIRGQSATAFTVLLTGDTDRDTVMTAKALNAQGYVVKPVTVEKIAGVVGRFKKGWLQAA